MTTFTRQSQKVAIKETPDSAVDDFAVGTDGTTTVRALQLAVQAIAAAGTDQATAAALIDGINAVSGATGANGVRLPVPGATGGDIVIVKNLAAATALRVFPNTGAAINALAANGVFATAASPVTAIFFATSPTQWYTLPLLPS